jgi:hypothetical protein
MAYKRKRPTENYAVLQGCIGEARHRIWDIVTGVQATWHRYQRSHLEIYDMPEHRIAFRSAVVFGLRRFADEVEELLVLIANDIDRSPDLCMAEPRLLVIELSVNVRTVRPAVVPIGLRYTLTRYLEMRWRRPEEIADDELRVLAVGLWGVWDKLEDGLRDFGRWLETMSKA